MKHIPNLFLRLAVVNGFFVVLLGAFGAHALREMVPVSALDTWQTAVQYHMFHVTGLLAVNLTVRFTGMRKELYWSGLAFSIGILLFSGSLYLMTLTSLRWLGMITPLGGVAFLLGWGLLFKAVLDDRT